MRAFLVCVWGYHRLVGLGRAAPATHENMGNRSMKMKSPMRALAAALLSPLLFLSVAGGAHAAENLVPVEAFVSQQTFENPRLSTEGSYVAVSVDLGDDTHGIMVFRLADMSQTAFMKLPKYELANEIHWVNDTQLVYVKGGKWGAREEPYDYGEIIAMDYDGRHHKYIYGWKETTKGAGLPKGHGNYAGRPLKPDGTFYMTRSTEESALGRSILYSVDVNTQNHDMVADVGGDQNLGFVLDHAGVPRFAFGTDKNDFQLLYVATDADGKNWRKLPGSEVGGTFLPIGFSADGKHVVGRYAVNNGPESLVKVDLGLANREVLATDGFNDVGSVTWDSQRQPLAVEFKGALPKMQILNPDSADARLLQELRGGFPGQHVRFVDHSANGIVSLIYIYSDRNPGEWAVFNRKTNALARLLQV